MSGRSGSVVAAHTIIAFTEGRDGGLSLSEARGRVLRRAIAKGGSTYVRGREVGVARALEASGLGTLIDDGSVRLGSRVDGERWTFKVDAKVTVRP